MNPSTKQVIVIDSVSTTNAATATGVIDTLAFDYCSIDITTSTSNNVTNNPSVLKLAESDDATTYTDITELVGDGVGGFTIPNSVTSGTWGCKMNVDCRARKRYLKLSVSPTTTQTITSIANLSKADESPVDTTSANVYALIEV